MAAYNQHDFRPPSTEYVPIIKSNNVIDDYDSDGFRYQSHPAVNRDSINEEDNVISQVSEVDSIIDNSNLLMNGKVNIMLNRRRVWNNDELKKFIQNGVQVVKVNSSLKYYLKVLNYNVIHS